MIQLETVGYSWDYPGLKIDDNGLGKYLMNTEGGVESPFVNVLEFPA